MKNIGFCPSGIGHYSMSFVPLLTHILTFEWMHDLIHNECIRYAHKKKSNRHFLNIWEI